MMRILKNKNYLLFKILFLLIISFLFIGINGFIPKMNMIVYADDEESGGYTEEQKNAAKAWLSAHGYAPTRAGAAQAYQDYLNGKFDNDPEVRKYKGLDTEDTTSSNNSADTNVATDGANPSNNDLSNTPDGSDAAASADNTNNKNSDVSAPAEQNSNESEEIIEVSVEELKEIKKQAFENELINNYNNLKLTSSNDVILIYEKNEIAENTNNNIRISSSIILVISICIVLLSIIIMIFKKNSRSKDLNI